MSNSAPRRSGFIAVAGSIGAGKSSLIRFLQERFGMLPFYEKNDDNPFLDDFYRDMPAFAFPAQVWFLARKFRAHREIGHLDRPAVLDRTIHEDAEVFAAHLAERGLFPRREYETYLALYRTIRDALPPPDLLIYLKSSVRTQRRRIALRGRAVGGGDRPGLPAGAQPALPRVDRALAPLAGARPGRRPPGLRRRPGAPGGRPHHPPPPPEQTAE